jgi:hypothetical protein
VLIEWKGVPTEEWCRYILQTADSQYAVRSIRLAPNVSTSSRSRSSASAQVETDQTAVPETAHRASADCSARS